MFDFQLFWMFFVAIDCFFLPIGGFRKSFSQQRMGIPSFSDFFQNFSIFGAEMVHDVLAALLGGWMMPRGSSSRSGGFKPSEEYVSLVLIGIFGLFFEG